MTPEEGYAVACARLEDLGDGLAREGAIAKAQVIQAAATWMRRWSVYGTYWEMGRPADPTLVWPWDADGRPVAEGDGR